MNRPVSAGQAQSLSRFSGDDTGGTIMCGICQAVYVPSRSHKYLLQAPPIALESAFMSMCHFCFRCRRPSCPNCWDDVHGVCGQCAEETHQPFRLEPASLDGVPFIPSYQSYPRTTQSSLISVRPGRFQVPPQSPIDRITTRPDRSSIVDAAAGPKELLAISIDVDAIKTRPMPRSKKSSAPSLSPGIDSIKTRPERTEDRTQGIERVLTASAFILLISVAILIVVALLSPDANAFISNVLHVDIRAEIAYLWHLLQQLF